ncbi:MAG: bifunctional glutamate N-acetyltransferase/amino-acid acetyltransferase ArgJ [Ruminococcus sp.]|nr:bifunctional glutamate N-acetyltransferase/amino-acid acetyltransferase ArgJ [Ruminococcus sp.]
MELKKIGDVTFIPGGVCAAPGFRAGGVQCGLSHAGAIPTAGKNDLAMIVCDTMCTAAAVYTTNKVKGAPIQVTKEHISDGKAQAVIVNSVNANTCNPDGVEKAEKMCRYAAKSLGLDEKDIIVASTGVIGQPLPIEPIKAGIPPLAESLSYDGNTAAVQAIMTTDTMPKEVAVQFHIGKKQCTLGGMLKGSGMIHPNMATTLTFLTTDAAISPELLQRALSDVVNVTLNRVSVDGDTSTNDMVCVLASGAAGNRVIDSEDKDFEAFETALYNVLLNLGRMMARDGEGATKLIECTVSGALNERSAVTVAKSVITSSLFKTMIFGEDANAGRIYCAVGYAETDLDINKVDIDIASRAGRIAVGRQGCLVEYSEEQAKAILSEDEIQVIITLGEGTASATAWGCDLTYDYVKINGDYRS